MASGGIGSVSQRGLNKERSGGSESTVKGSERGDATQGSTCIVSQRGGEGQGKMGACAEGLWVLANR